jgi:hypothetical protein
VRQRFVNVGKSYFFPDGAKAFEDHGKRLSTTSENTEVIRSLLAIAQARGWNKIVVRGSDRFRQEIWRQAVDLNIQVRGYTPTEVEKAKVAKVRAAATPAAQTAPPPGQRHSRAHTRTDSENPAATQSHGGSSAPTSNPVQGQLVASGAARYRHDPKAAVSYFITLQTSGGERTVWGRDLERAIRNSNSRPKVGDEVVLRQEGRDPVTVRIPVKNPDGSTATREESRYRNRWSVETGEWINARVSLADSVRKREGSPSGQVHPEVLNALLTVRQAELLAEKHIRSTEHRALFVEAVREHLADRLATGRSIPEATLHDRTAERAPLEPAGPG